MEEDVTKKQALAVGIVFGAAFLSLLLLHMLLPGFSEGGRGLLLFCAAAAALTGAAYHFLELRHRRQQKRVDRIVGAISSGNLAIGVDSQAAKVLAALPGFQTLLRSFRNIIGYLQDASENVAMASGRISEKTRRLILDAGEQVDSSETARESIRQLDEEIEKVVVSVDALSGYTESTGTAILEMQSSSEEVVSATHTLASFTDENATSIEEMTHSIEEVAGHADSLAAFASENSSAMVQMDATIGQIEENIKETEGMSDEVSQSAQQGMKVVKETAEGLRKIHEAMSTTLEAIDTLGKRSKQIGNILKVIREIADQTNLLALNAAIIAAQAGEHGKSFGVVAEEIRDLSERTSASTAEVSDIILAIQKDVDGVGSIASEGMQRVEEGLQLGQHSEESLQKIGQAISMAGTSISHIAKAATEQAKGSRQVTAAMEEMTKRIERISVATREQAQTSQIISKKTQTMMELTRNVDNAMREQAEGSESIVKGMEQVRLSVDSIQKALLRMSQAGQRMVQAMDVIGGAAQQNLAGARDLAATSNVLRQESLLLVEELANFSIPKPVKGGELVAGYTRYDFNLDPIFANNVRDGELVYNIHEGLVRFGHGTRVLPAVAKEWNLSADGRVYTFHLNPEATFHSGRTVTAKDVVYSFHRSMSPKLDNEGKWFLEWAEGIDEYIQGRSETISGLSAPDEHTVEIRLKEPLAFFLYMLTAPEASVLPTEMIDEHTLKLLRPVGCGPFHVVEATKDRVLMEKFPQYHQADIPHLDRLIFDYSARDGDESIHLLETGQVDFVPALPNESSEKLLQDPFWANHAEMALNLNTTFIAIRCDLEPFHVKETRQALNYAVDREYLASLSPHSRPTPANGMLPPGILAYSPDRKGYHYDRDKARWLMSKAGYSNGVDLKVPLDESRVNQLRDFHALVEMWRGAGIRIIPETLTHEAFVELRKKEGRPILYSTGWFADYPDPDNFLYVLFHSGAGDILDLKYANERLDDLVERGRRCLDIDERIELYREAEDIVVDDAPCVFLYHSQGLVPHQPDIMGMKLFLTPPSVRPEHLWLNR